MRLSSTASAPTAAPSGRGTVERLDAPVLPHMGWNTVEVAPGSALFAGIGAGTRFYFVHSYALRMRDAGPLLADGAAITVAEHGEPFAAAVEHGVVAATQFHPEKSGDMPLPPGAVQLARASCRSRHPRHDHEAFVHLFDAFSLRQEQILRDHARVHARRLDNSREAGRLLVFGLRSARTSGDNVRLLEAL